MTNKPRAATILLDSRFQHTCYASAMTLFLVIVVIGSIPGARHNLGQYASGLVTFPPNPLSRVACIAGLFVHR